MRVLHLCLLLAGVALALSVGCSRNGEPTASGGLPPGVAEAVQQLAEGTNVLTALSQKDYDGAVSALVRAQQAATPEQEASVAILRNHVRNQLLEASETDPKANEALSVVRSMISGR